MTSTMDLGLAALADGGGGDSGTIAAAIGVLAAGMGLGSALEDYWTAWRARRADALRYGPLDLLYENELGLRYDGEDAVEHAKRLAVEAGAVPPVEYLGTGMTAQVLVDKTGLAYKVPRSVLAARTIADEAAWLETASQVPYVQDHVVRFVRCDPKTGVLVREAVEGRRHTRGKPGRLDRWDTHMTISKMMEPYGFGMPEMKEESYRSVRGRGWVCFDAGFAQQTGHRLLAEAATVPSEGSEGANLAFAISMESGRTIPKAIADRALATLAQRSVSAKEYLFGR